MRILKSANDLKVIKLDGAQAQAQAKAQARDITLVLLVTEKDQSELLELTKKNFDQDYIKTLYAEPPEHRSFDDSSYDVNAKISRNERFIDTNKDEPNAATESDFFRLYYGIKIPASKYAEYAAASAAKKANRKAAAAAAKDPATAIVDTEKIVEKGTPVAVTEGLQGSTTSEVSAAGAVSAASANTNNTSETEKIVGTLEIYTSGAMLEFGLFVDQALSGIGLGQLALQAGVDLVTNFTNVKTLKWECYRDNLASVNVAKKVGFKHVPGRDCHMYDDRYGSLFYLKIDRTAHPVAAQDSDSE
jgi:hypothetical protein